MPSKSVEEKVFAINDSRVVEYLWGEKGPWPIPTSQHLGKLTKDGSYFNSMVKKKKIKIWAKDLNRYFSKEDT